MSVLLRVIVVDDGVVVDVVVDVVVGVVGVDVWGVYVVCVVIGVVGGGGDVAVIGVIWCC